MSKKIIHVYLICPVRNVTTEQKQFLDDYVAKLESRNYVVHYPPRDVDQSMDGNKICEAHRESMIECDECHVYFDAASTGSHFDLGMAYVMQALHGTKIILINDLEKTPHKSYTNFLIELDRREKVREEETKDGNEWSNK